MSDEDSRGAMYCTPTAEGRCTTCSDMALPATVLHVDQESGLAAVALESAKETMEEIDISLLEAVVPGDVVLVHAGVAIALFGEAGDE